MVVLEVFNIRNNLLDAEQGKNILPGSSTAPKVR